MSIPITATFATSASGQPELTIAGTSAATAEYAAAAQALFTNLDPILAGQKKLTVASGVQTLEAVAAALKQQSGVLSLASFASMVFQGLANAVTDIDGVVQDVETDFGRAVGDISSI